MKKIQSEFLNTEKIDAFVEENKGKKLFELFEVKEDYDIGDVESRCIEQLDLHVRIYNTFKHFNRDVIGKGPDPSRNLLDITVGELESKFRRFIGKKGIVELLEKLNFFFAGEYYYTCSEFSDEFIKKDDGTVEIALEISETGEKPRCVVTAGGKPKGSIICEPAEINRCFNGLKTLIYKTLIGDNYGVVGIEYEDIKNTVTSTGVYNSYCVENSSDASLDLLKTEFEKIKTGFEANDKLAGIITVTGNVDFGEFESICSLYGKTVTDSNLVGLYPKERSNEIIIDVWTMKK